MRLQLDIFLSRYCVWKNENALRYLAVVPTDWENVWCVHIIDANLSGNHCTFLRDFSVVQIRDICDRPGECFPFLVIVPHNKKTVIIKDLMHKIMRSLIVQSNCNPFIEQEISNIFTQFLCHPHAFSPAALICSTTAVHLVKREISDISFIPGYPLCYLPVK